MSINKCVIWLVVLGYVVVNVTMQVDFFAGHDIFDKYRKAATAGQALSIAQQAYYAKTAFLLALLVLQACSVRFALAFGLAFALYAALMLVFFGLSLVTALYALAAVALLASYWVERRTRGGGGAPA